MKRNLLHIAIQAALFGSLTAYAGAAETQASQLQDVEVSSAEAATQATAAEPTKKVDEKITVTGSRIKRDSFSMATPMMLMSGEEIDDSGLSELADILVDEMPSISAGVSNTNSQSSVQNTGLSTIDLRDLGTNRTLTLIDGRRVVSNSYSGNYVSLSTIPSAFVDRVEVISGGASAVYGSDAIAGVVNIITESSKTGFEIDARAGTTTDGGGEETSIDIGYGTEIDGARGFLFGAISWDREYGLKKTDRDRSSTLAYYNYDTTNMCNEMYTVDGYQCMRDIDKSDWVYLSSYIPGGRFEGYDYFYNSNNELSTDMNRYVDGYNTYIEGNLKIPNDKLTAALKFDYDLTDDISLKTQLHYSDTFSHNVKSANGFAYSSEELAVYADGTSELISAGSMSPDNPYAPAEIAENAGSSISWYRRFTEVGNVVNDNKRRTIRAIASLEGTAFSGDWDWELAMSYGSFRQQQDRQNEISLVRLSQALDAEYADDGSIQCADADARAAGCVAINLFGNDSITDEMADWIRVNPWIRTDIRQLDVSGYMTGDLFTLPAGNVSAAFGFEFRRDSQQVRVDEEMRTLAITFNDVPSFKGSIHVMEAFAETTVPLLKDVTLAKRLDLEASLRLADYNIDNVDLMSSYRLGLFWEPVEGYGLRANYARSQRAPTITELMSPARGDYDSFTDICDGVTATSTGAGHDNCRLDAGIAAAIEAEGVFEDENSGYSPNAGNSELKEETADTYTLGLTLNPIDSLNIALDLYNIQIDDAITSVSNADIMSQCYDSSVTLGGDNPFCDLITRDSEGQITQILQMEYNLAQEKAKGWDLSMVYDYDIGSYGKLKLKANMNHVIERSSTYEGVDGLEKTEYNGALYYGVFTDQAAVSLTWHKDDWRITWRTKYKSDIVDSHERVEEWKELYAANQAALEAGDESAVENPETPKYLFYPSYITHDISVNYSLNFEANKEMEMDIYGGIRNLFNDKGPFIPNGGDNYETGTGNFNSAYGGGVGRYAYVGAKLKF